jgi:hypothetical protein
MTRYSVTFYFQGKPKRLTRTYYTPEQIERNIRAEWPGAKFIVITRL